MPGSSTSYCNHARHRGSVAELNWFDLYPPNNSELTDVVRAIRPLASRPRVGFFRRMPPVVLELWSLGGKIRWQLGIEEKLVSWRLAHQLTAHLPGLRLAPRTAPSRPRHLLVSDVLLTGSTQPLRTDLAETVSTSLLNVLSGLRREESAVIQWIIGPVQSRRTIPRAFNPLEAIGLVPPRPSTPHDDRWWHNKSSEPLFAVRGQVGAVGVRAAVHSLGNALALAGASHVEVRLSQPTPSCGHVLNPAKRCRRWSGLLNAAELAALLGWPLQGSSSPAVTGLSLHPAPSQLHHKDAKLGTAARSIGVDQHPAGKGSLVAMPLSTCLHHVHVVGPTGSGKTNLLARFARADVAAGHNVLVIEPRGHLVQNVLAGVPPSRLNDVVLIEPGCGDRVIGFNPLRGHSGEAEAQADQLLHLFRRVFGANVGPRSSDVLLHTLIAAARSPDGTLADVPELLTNSSFRRRIKAGVTDQLVLSPFFSWFDSLSPGQHAQVVAPVLNKLRAFTSRSAIRHVLGQPHPRFEIDDLSHARRIVLVNLNEGLIGAEAASLLSGLILIELWAGIQRRARQPTAERIPLMVIIDEVQDYLHAPIHLPDMLAQARNLDVSLTLAHQDLSQPSAEVLAALFANARSRITFRPARADGKRLAAAFGPGVTANDLDQLGAFEACGQLLLDGVTTAAFRVHTPKLGQQLSDPAVVRARSLERYGTPADTVDADLIMRWRSRLSDLSAPIGIKPREGR